VDAAGERGGVLLRVRGGGLGGGAPTADPDGDALGFVPADVALRIASLSALTAVPGARPPVLGIALAEGAIVTVIRLGDQGGVDPRRPYQPDQDWIVPGADRAVVCRLGSFDVALTGATVVATGVFDGAPGGEGVLWRGEVVPLIDVRALYAQAEAATWAGRALPPRPRWATQPPPAPPPSTIGAPPGEPGCAPKAPHEDERWP
jgi:hypothetical protein